MDKLEIEATQYTPHIVMDDAGEIAIVGKSYPENTFDFYAPVIEWLKQYFSEKAGQGLTVNIELLYFNSSSSKLFFDFFDILNDNKDETEVTINWIYDEENESAEEAGEDFVEDFDELTINMNVKEE